jgi:hypothetical protein
MRRATAVLLLAGLLAVAGGSLTAGTAGASSTRRREPRRTMATYEWHNAGDLAAVEVRQRLRFLRAHGFTTVYLELGSYLEAADQPKGSPGRQRRLNEFRRQLRRFVATASSLGLAVHGLGGGPTWIGELSYLGPLLVRLAGRYNAGVAPRERLQGVQLDIEPYAVDGFLQRGEEGFVEYLEALRGIVRAFKRIRYQHANRYLQLGLAIPFWFDAEDDEAPGPVRFRGEVKPVAHHIIDMVRRLDRAYLVVMSYRNVATGADGSIVNARDEFTYARSVDARCALLVGQQFGDVQPPEVTFHGRHRRAFEHAAEQIVEAFERFPQFRGLAVDDVDGYTAVWQRDAAA